MTYPYLKTTQIANVTGLFRGGSLAFLGNQYMLLDATATAPRLVVLDHSLQSPRYISLPVHANYVGLTFFGSSLLVLRKKGTLCEDGRIAVAELLSVSLLTGEVHQIQEVYSYKNIEPLGGVCSPPDGLMFAGSFAGKRSFYRIEKTDVVKIADFSDTVTGLSSLAFDGSDVFLLNGSNTALAFNSRWLTADTAKNTPLNGSNDNPVGTTWNGSALVVLDSNPLAAFFYGTDGGGTTPTGTVGLSDNRQLFMADNRLEAFTAGATSFQAIHSEFVRRTPFNDGGIIRIVEESEIRVTPEFVLTGVGVGTVLSKDTERFRVSGVIRMGDSYRQSFVCKLAD